MNKLSLKIDNSYYMNDGLIEYLSMLKGVNLVKIDIANEEIYIEYDSKIISLKLLKMEIFLYLNIGTEPSIITFNKYPINNTIKTTIIIKDLCCEYCLKGMIEELFEIDGIESANTNYDYSDKSDVYIFITYNPNKIDKKKIDELEKEFNN